MTPLTDAPATPSTASSDVSASTVPAAPAIPAVSISERAERLASAASAWGDRISENPATANLTFRASGVGVGAVASTIRAGRHRVVVDEPAALAGDDVAASPVEYALAALISCQVVVYRLYAQALGITLLDVAIEAEGDLDARRLFGFDESVRAGFSDVRLVVTLTGPESEERYQYLRDVVDAHCPVLDLFQNPTPVSVTVRKG
ncbi:putative OsmC-like protein [Microcella alkaliphila]|uniref:Putative OsmC-like protein n=1 Tax=Microcella alkaliphila TaxID=279828 RepID=A0A4Q7TND2_9MICO|nr:OsmC family protein [Microcella alkaliphila]RZT62341.1 putative OsmC-like protein [Microcella alkaliphila]